MPLSDRPTEKYRTIANALAIVCASAFAGCNLFIGLSIGTLWTGMEPAAFMAGFWDQFLHFTYTVMPLFIATLVGLALSAKLDWKHANVRRYWVLALTLFAAVSLITIFYHLPENLRLYAGAYTADEAAAARSMWLTLHVPRVLLSFGIPVCALAAVRARLVTPPSVSERSDASGRV